MTKIYTQPAVEIEHCIECRNLMMRKYCLKDLTKGQRVIPDPYGGIPEWCPLPDKVEAKK